MEVLDTTIAVVALRYIAGGLSATVDDGEWVITSYLAANAIILPITGWLIAHLGRHQLFPAVDRRVHPRFRAGWNGNASRPTVPVPRSAGFGRRWSPAIQPGRAAGCLSGGEARHRNDAVRLCRADRTGRRPDPRRLDNRRLFLAVGVPGSTSPSACWRWVRVPSHSRDPDYLTTQRMELRKRPFRFDGIGLSLLVIVVVCWGGDTQQGPGMGLAGRSVLACADAGDPVRCRPGRADLLGAAPSESGGEFPAAARTELHRLLHHHLLRLRGAVRCQHHVACLAPIAVQLRRTERRTGHVTGWILCRGRHAVRGARAWSRNRCAVGASRGSADHGRGELLDVADEPGHQSGAGSFGRGWC